MKSSFGTASRTAQSQTERNRKYRSHSEKARLDANRAAYLGRKFVGVDGEGINVRSGKRRGAHDYVLLAITDVPPILAKDGLSSREIFDYLWTNLSGQNINVIYGGSYDFNCWVAGLPEHLLRELYEGGKYGVRYGPYTIKWRKGKSFRIKRDGKSVTIYDIVSFFQRPFIAACDEYLGKKYPGRAQMIREKARRGNFRWSEIARIGQYNNYELETLVNLATELRARLDRVGLRPKQWIGPGAIAAALFEREKIKDHMSRDLPLEVAEAARYAYAGGRFECLKFGVSKSRAWEYDVNSAYPKALSLVPSLADGDWKYTGRGSVIRPDSFALYRIRWENPNPEGLPIPGPLFVRGANGTISYPMRGENWVWSPEAGNMAEYSRITGTRYTVLEAWTLTPKTGHRPFGFIPAMYERRKALKAAGDGAHVGIKLGLNSCYGKCAQQVGWNKETGEPPIYHQLEWAGFATSWCRAAVMRAAMLDLDAVIAFETDALFTSRPLEIPVSDRLGEWEETVFESLSYVQSGHYYGTAWEKGELVEVAKCRGIDRGNVSRAAVEQGMQAPLQYRTLRAPLTRFMGLGVALMRGLHIWRRWIVEEKNLALYPMGKRAPVSDELAEGWNATICPVSGGMSSPFPIEWINPDPNMTELAELRELEVTWDE